jgi:hypothetical protein
MEDVFAEQVIGERARLFWMGALDRMRESRLVRDLPASRSGFLILFSEELLKKCMQWTNEHIVLHELPMNRLNLWDMWRYLAVTLLSHTTGLSIEKTIEMLQNVGASPPSLESVRRITTLIKAFSAMGRGRTGERNWNSQRDQTAQLEPFEHAAFHSSCKIFLQPSHSILTLDDDLYGTRASDNQVKHLSSRKADKEGHCADALAEPFTRVTVYVRFRRRGQRQEENVETMLSSVLREFGSQSVHGLVITADRGYGKIRMLQSLMSRGVHSLFIMPEHLVQCHPFVAKSFLHAGRLDEDEIEREAVNSSSEEGAENSVDSNAELEEEFEALAQNMRRSNHPRSFVIDDDPVQPPSVFYATKKVRAPRMEGREAQREQIVAVAIRERGTEKFSKVLRFMHNLPEPMSRLTNTWIATPRPETCAHLLFGAWSKRNSPSQWPTPDENSEKCCVARHVMDRCQVLTIGQRCADWFILRRYRITGTIASQLTMSRDELRVLLGLGPARGNEKTPQQQLRSCADSWFSRSRSTEAMMRGTVNEGACVSALAKLAFVKTIFEVGMIALKEAPWIACSPDGIALIDLEALGFVQDAGGTKELASVEIKTSVAESSLRSAVSNASVDVVTCDLGDETFRRHIPEDHMAQMIQQMIVLTTPFAIYVSASETGIMFVLVIRGSANCLGEWKKALLSTGGSLVEWAHTSATATAPEYADVETKALLKSGFKFWSIVNREVVKNGPFPPIKTFKHGIQCLYSKTKGGVDGSAQARAIMRSTTISPQWEQKLVTQTFKTLAVNAFVGYRLHCKGDLLQSREAFRGINSFRAAMNSMQSLADFIYDVSPNLLSHADRLEKEARAREREAAAASSALNEEILSDAAVARLSAQASLRKRRRLDFFNDDDGKRLRLAKVPHLQNQTATPQYCALCGCNNTHPGSQSADESRDNARQYRGRRSTFKCSLCHVHLCVRTYPGLRKSCWDLFHSARMLTTRQTPPPTRAREAGH